jgi:hypothetical protein
LLVDDKAAENLPNLPAFIDKLVDYGGHKLLPIQNESSLQSELLDHTYIVPPLGIGISASFNKSRNRTAVNLLFNGAATHAPPAALLLLSNAQINQTLGISVSRDVILVSTKAVSIFR